MNNVQLNQYGWVTVFIETAATLTLLILIPLNLTNSNLEYIPIGLFTTASLSFIHMYIRYKHRSSLIFAISTAILSIFLFFVKISF